MIKCIECDNCLIDTDEFTNAKARCKLSTPPSKGKIITWACTTYETIEDAMLGRVKEYGEDRVLDALEKQKRTRRWCPKKNDGTILAP